jgi:hypothetical protein
MGKRAARAAQRERTDVIGFWARMRSGDEEAEGADCTHGRIAEPSSLNLSVKWRNVDADFSQFVVVRRSSN